MRSVFAVRSPNVTALRALNYAPAVEAFRAKANSRSCRRLGDLLANIGLGYGSVFTRLDCDLAHGIELVSQGDMFATEPAGRIIRRDSIPNSSEHEIQRWQVLVAGAGTLGENELYGRSIIADGRLAGRYVGPDAMTMTFEVPGSVESLYAYAFLCTKIGVQCVRATSYGTKVLRLRSEMLSDLPIPFASDRFVDQVSELIRRAVLKRDAYALELRKARDIVEAIPEYAAASEMCAASKPRATAYPGKTFPTLSAWNYAATGGALEYLRRQWGCRLRDVVDSQRISYGPRFARIPCSPPFGVDFWSQRDVFLMRPIPRRIKDPRGSEQRVPEASIFISARGQLEEGNLFGRVELGVFGGSSAVVTGDAIPLIPSPGQSDCLYTYLSTSLGLRLLRTCAIGTSIPAMHLGLLADLPVPELDTQQLAAVKRHLHAAIDARVIASSAESDAIRMIEEEVLPEWLS